MNQTIIGYIWVAFVLACNIIFVILLLKMLHILKRQNNYKNYFLPFFYYSDFKDVIKKEGDATLVIKYWNLTLLWQGKSVIYQMVRL